MRNRPHTLLAGIAALALFAASGIAFAQQNQQGSGGTAQSSTQSQRGQQGARNQSANQGMRNQGAQQGRNQNAMSRQSSGQNARNQSGMQSRQGNAGSSNRSAQNRNRGTSATNRTAQGGQNQRNATAQSRNGQLATQQQRNRTQRGTSTAQRNEQLRGLQGSTRAPTQGATSTQQGGGGGANVSLNDRQRTQIRDSVLNATNVPRVSNPRFSVNVGTVVPRGQIRLVRVPPPLLRIRPAWRNFLYFVYNDRIVIVNPRTMRIVDVLPV
jgi:Protein of unknown function (DUF1236)